MLETNENELNGGERLYPKYFNEAWPDHRERYQLALQYIKQGNKVLDAACGVGYGSCYLARNSGCDGVVGIDINEHALKWAETYFWDDKVRYYLMNLTETVGSELLNEKFDVITSFETIEHLLNERKFLENIKSMLRVGGVFLVSAPNEDVIPCFSNPFQPTGRNPHHQRHYRPSEFQRLLEVNGFFIHDNFTQSPDTVIRGQHGWTNILVCSNVPPAQAPVMNYMDEALETLSIAKMYGMWPQLGGPLGESAPFSSYHIRIRDLTDNYSILSKALNQIRLGGGQDALTLLNDINEFSCPEVSLFRGLSYHLMGDLPRAVEMYSKILILREKLHPQIVTWADQNLTALLKDKLK